MSPTPLNQSFNLFPVGLIWTLEIVDLLGIP
nr:MAG TPA: hypothetical protein [Bacteriophage sp.]